MKLSGFGPGGKLRHDVELAEKLANQFAGVFPLAQLLHLLENARQRVLGLRDRDFGVVLALSLEALMVLAELFTEKLNHALTGRAVQWSRLARGVDGSQTTLQGHRGRADPV